MTDSRRRLRPMTVPFLAVAVISAVLAGGRVYDRTMVSAAAFPSADSAHLIFLFHAADCIEYRGMEEAVIALVQETGIRAVGILLDHSTDSAHSPLEAQRFALGFPVQAARHREYERSMLRLGILATPAIVLVDGQGVARLTAPPTKNPLVLSALRRSLAAYIPILLSDR